MIFVSYNVRRCIGADGRQQPRRIADVLAQIAPDVVALQEVDSESAGSAHADQLAYLAAALRMQPVAGPALRRDYGGYGNGLLTRFPVARVRRHDISEPRCEPRAVLEVEVAAPRGLLHVINTHLGLRRRERSRQGARLLSLVRGASPATLVVAGDFNEWWPLARHLRLLRSALGPARAPASFPARWPVLALDRIWVRPPEALQHIAAWDTSQTRRASDHLPLVARVGA